MKQAIKINEYFVLFRRETYIYIYFTCFFVSGMFERYYGGSVFNGFDQTNGVLYHVLRVADSAADVIVSVDVKGRTARFSKLTNLRHIHNLSLSPK